MTIRFINGQNFIHLQHSQLRDPDGHLLDGLYKKPKLAKLNGSIVLRLVETPFSSEFKIRKRLFLQGIAIVNELQDLPGIYRHINHCFVERVKNKTYDQQIKIESYDECYKYDLMTCLHTPPENKLKGIWILKLLDTLQQMHNRERYHLDIKEENIFVGADPQTIVLGDFDCAWKKGYPSNLGLGTCECLPPEFSELVERFGDKIPKSESEFNEYKNFLASRDVWAMGLVFYRLVKGERLHYYQYPRKDQIARIPFIRNEPQYDAVEYVIWRMLCPEPRDRISAREAYKMMQCAIQ